MYIGSSRYKQHKIKYSIAFSRILTDSVYIINIYTIERNFSLLE
jgi:hypothetical protein